MAERSDNTLLVRRYAAAWRLASEAQAPGKLVADLDTLKSSLCQDSALDALVQNPSIPKHILAAALKQVAEKAGLSTTTAQFLFVLTNAGRLALLSKVLAELQLQLDTAAGISHAKLTSATPLADAEVARLQKLLSEQLKSDVRLTTAVDPALIGGVQIEMNSWLMDASLNGQLSRLEHQLKSTKAA